MNKKASLKLRNMAAKAAINCTPKKLSKEDRDRHELNTGSHTFDSLKRLWKGMSASEKGGLKQSFVDDLARKIAFPPKKTAKKKTKKKPRTKNKAKTTARAKAKTESRKVEETEAA